MEFKVFKGCLLSPRDLYYLINDDHSYAEKVDGVSTKVVVYQNDVWAQSDDGKQYHTSLSGRSITNPCLTLSCERIYSDGSPKFILSEPVHMGAHTPQSFQGRMRAWRDSVLLDPQLGSAVLSKEWFHDYASAREAMEVGNWEGLVVMAHNSAAYWIPDVPLRAKQARYIKRSLTVDVLDVDGVVREYRYPRTTGDLPLKTRSDKKVGNSRYDVDMLDSGILASTADVIFCSPPPTELQLTNFLDWVSGAGRASSPDDPAMYASAIYVLRNKWAPRPTFVEDDDQLMMSWNRFVDSPGSYIVSLDFNSLPLAPHFVLQPQLNSEYLEDY